MQNFTEQSVYCICSTDGNLIPCIIFSDQDRIEWKNRAAITANSLGIIIIVYAIMKNHVHFLVRGDKEDANRFMAILIGEMKKYYQCKGIHLNGLLVKGVREVQDDEHLQNALAYVLRNPMTAGDYKGMFTNTNLLICIAPWMNSNVGMKQMSDISFRDRKSSFRTIQTLPGEWFFSDNYEIWDGSFTDYNAAVRIMSNIGLFWTKIGMSKNLVETDVLVANSFDKCGMKDSDLRQAAEDLAFKFERTRQMEKLSLEGCCKVASALHKQYGITAKRLSRLLHLNAGYMESMFEN